jgi:hypothetical protein
MRSNVVPQIGRISSLGLLLVVNICILIQPSPAEATLSRSTPAGPLAVQKPANAPATNNVPSPTSCLIYGVHVENENYSQLFTVDPRTREFNPLGYFLIGHDIEGLAIHPQTNVLYAAARANGNDDWHLYTVNAQDGQLGLVGPLAFDRVMGLAFRPTDATLWGWAEGAGLIRIDVQTGRGTLVYPSTEKIKGLAWNWAGTLLYGAHRNKLWVYDPRHPQLTQVTEDLPEATGALETRPDGQLLGGLYNHPALSIYTYDVGTLQQVVGEDFRTPYRGVAGIAWPSSCDNPPPPTPSPVDEYEPNNLCADASQLSFNVPLSATLHISEDVDFFKIYVEAPYTTVTVRMNHATQDYDLALYDLCPETGGIILPHHVGESRDRNEELVTFNVGRSPGWYFVKVVGFSGAFSATPYAIQATFTPPHFGALILTYRERLTRRYGADAVQTLFSKLGELSDHGTVQGLMVDVTESPAVLAAYEHWDTNPRDPTRANDVAEAIKALTREKLRSYPTIRYLIVVGGDAIMPFYRVPIRPYGKGSTLGWVTESAYLAAVGGVWNEDDSTVAALRNDFTLTDDFYGSDEGIPFQDHKLYIPTHPVGRLVETPEEMGTVIDAYLSISGERQLGQAFAVGGNFIADAADAACELFNADGVPVTCRADNLWNSVWLQSNVLNGLFDIATVDSHASHFNILAPAGGQLTASDIASASASLSGLTLYTLGCQTGLNVAPGNPQALDFAQALAGRGANLVGNTGWSYGIVEGFGLSESLIKLFTEALLEGTGTTLGDALIEAKRAYYLRHAHLSHYDEKILTEFTLYGLPMLRVKTPAGLATMTTAARQQPWMNFNPVAEERAYTVQSPKRRLAEQTSLNLELRVLEFPREDLVQQSTPWGTYYTYRTDTQGDPGFPLQPRYVASTYATSGPAHGVAFIEGKYADHSGFDPVIVKPLTPNGSPPGEEPGLESSGWAPAAFVGLRHLPGVLGDGTASTVVMHLGQFDGQRAVERLYEKVSILLFRSDSDDWTPPIVGGVEAVQVDQSTRVTVRASDSASGIFTVLVPYTTGSGEWHSVELIESAEGTWHGTIPAAGGVSFFVEVVDAAGNVAVDTNAGRYYSGTCVQPCRSEYVTYLPMVLR